MINNNKKNLKEKDKQGKMIIAILLLIAIIGVGYAALGANLKINGVANIPSAQWNVHFVQNSITPTTGSVAIDTANNEKAATVDSATEVSYKVKLALPGDFYEFTVDVTNEGSIDAMIDSISSKIKIGTGEEEEITTSPSNLPAYLDYSVSYSDGKSITAKQKLDAGDTETIKVRLSYKTDITSTDLPTTNQILALNFKVNYVQKDSTAVEVVHPVNGTKYTMSYGQNGQIGQNVINGVPLYNRAQEAISSTGKDFPFYLKHTVVNDQITESYLELEINETTKQSIIAKACSGDSTCEAKINAINNGTYTLRGAGATLKSGSTSDYNGDSPYYEANKAVIKQIFGENCGTESNPGRDTAFLGCSVIGGWYSSFGVSVDATGTVNASITGGSGSECRVNSSGRSCFGSSC